MKRVKPGQQVDTRKSTADVVKPEPKRGRFCAWHSMSLLEYHNHEMRNLSPELIEKGWHAFVNRYMHPVLDHKLIDVERGDFQCVWNPFGFIMPDDMRGDQAELCDAAGGVLQKLLEEFPGAIRSVTHRCEVMAYIGRVQGILHERLGETAYGDIGALSYALSWYDAVVRAGCSLGWDVMTNMPESDPAWRLYRLIQSVGVKSYVEPLPSPTDVHMANEDCIVTETFWVTLMKRTWQPWNLPRELYKGRILRIMNDPTLYDPSATWMNCRDWIGKWVASVWDDGHDAAFAGGPLLEIGKSIDELVAEARRSR